MRARALGCLLACALCFAQACGPQDEASALDASAWLAEIERAHATADRSAPAEASAALREALALPVPPEVDPDDRRVVQQDLAFRIARAELAVGRSEQALVAADRGLSSGVQTDVFCANLYLARGEALEALGRDSEAASSYYEALEINRKLLDALMAERSRARLGAGDAGTP